MKGGDKDRTITHQPRGLLAARKSGVATLSALSRLFGKQPEKGETPGDVALDPVIHERTRLSILTALFTLGEPGCSFLDLRDTLSLTDGNLMAHLRTLEEAGLIARSKEGAGRKSNTTVQLTPAGRKAFRNYLDRLELLLRAARQNQPGSKLA